jgi:hypothetical protein
VVALVLFGYARMPDKISFFDVSGFCTIPTQLVLHVISRRNQPYRCCLRELQYLLVLLDGNSGTVATPGTTLSLLGQSQITRTHKRGMVQFSTRTVHCRRVVVIIREMVSPI